MMRKLLFVFGILLLPLCALAQGPGYIRVLPSVAQLRASIPAGVAPQFGNVEVSSYYGTGNSCPIFYIWNSSDSRSDDGGGVINPTGNSGNGRWNIQLAPGGYPRTCQWGVKVDSAYNSATEGTNNATQMQAIINWAYSYGPNRVLLDTVKGECIGFNTTLNPNEGEIIEGNGSQSNSALNPGNSCLAFYGNSGPAILLQTPYPGNGTTPFQGPQFKNFGVLISIDNANTSATGCIQLNSVAGGFTNDSTSQQPIVHPVFENLTCTMGFGLTGQTGFFCAKCFDGRLTTVESNFGNVGIDIEGSDDMEATDCRITQPYAYHMKFVQRGGGAQFGNMDRVVGCQWLNFAPESQSVDAFMYDSAVSSEIRSVFIEGPAPSGGSLAAQINIAGGLLHLIENNYISGGPPGGPTVPWIEFSSCPFNVTAINNAVAASVGNVTWPSNFGCPYWYNSSLQSQYVHYGNTLKGDNLWPFNSLPYNSTPIPSGAFAIYTTSTPGLVYAGLGTSEIPSSNAFVIGPTGSSTSNYLQFQNGFSGSVAIVGTIHTAQFTALFQTNNATGQITCQVVDNGTLVGSTVAQSITGNPLPYTLTFNQAVTTSGGVRCWNTGTSGIAPQGIDFTSLVLQ